MTVKEILSDVCGIRITYVLHKVLLVPVPISQSGSHDWTMDIELTAELGTCYFFPGSLIAKLLICFRRSLSLKRNFFEFPGSLTLNHYKKTVVCYCNVC